MAIVDDKVADDTEHVVLLRWAPRYPVWFYVLNTRKEGKNTRFYSYLACDVHTPTLNIYVFMSYTGVKQTEYVIRILVAAPQEYVNTHSTCRRMLALPTVLAFPVSGQMRNVYAGGNWPGIQSGALMWSCTRDPRTSHRASRFVLNLRLTLGLRVT